MTTFAQRARIHILKDSIEGFEEADYRALIGRIRRGATSSKDLTFSEGGRLIDALKALGAVDRPRPAKARADGPYAGKLRALWIALYHLGEVQNRDDRALAHFAKRQAGVDHTRFLVDAGEAAKVIEALKSWLVRAGVPRAALDGDDVLEAKRAVAKRAAFLCVESGAFTGFTPGAPFEDASGAVVGVWPVWFEQYGAALGNPAGGFAHYEGAHWDELARALGAKRRKHLREICREVAAVAKTRAVA